MPRRGYVATDTTVGAGDRYLVVGPMVGPGTLLWVEAIVENESAADYNLGFGLSRSDEATEEAFAASVPLHRNVVAVSGPHTYRTGRVTHSGRGRRTSMRLPVGLELVAASYWVICYHKSDNAASQDGVWLIAEVDYRRGFGRRAGDVAVQVAPAGAGVLAGLRDEARRASGRES